MAKTITTVIQNCWQCDFRGSTYDNNMMRCDKLNKTVKGFTIDPDCPLPDSPLTEEQPWYQSCKNCNDWINHTRCFKCQRFSEFQPKESTQSNFNNLPVKTKEQNPRDEFIDKIYEKFKKLLAEFSDEDLEKWLKLDNQRMNNSEIAENFLKAWDEAQKGIDLKKQQEGVQPLTEEQIRNSAENWFLEQRVKNKREFPEITLDVEDLLTDFALFLHSPAETKRPTHDEMMTSLTKFGKVVTSSPEKATQFLKDIGFLDEHGKIQSPAEKQTEEIEDMCASCEYKGTFSDLCDTCDDSNNNFHPK